MVTVTMVTVTMVTVTMVTVTMVTVTMVTVTMITVTMVTVTMVTVGGANGEMANLTNKKGRFAIAIFRHFSPLVVFEIRHFCH